MHTLADIVNDWSLWGVSDQPLDVNNFTPLVGGLTNQNYRLAVAGDVYVLRMAANNGDELGLDRACEYQVHQQMAQAGLVPEVVYHDPRQRYWLRRFQTGTPLSATAINPSMLQALAQIFQRIHAQPVIPDLAVFVAMDKAVNYWAMIHAHVAQSDVSDQVAVWHELEQSCQQRIRALALPDTPFAICHLDPIPANWLNTEQGWQLLDWEYAAIAHPLLDLASLSLYLNLTVQQQHILCRAYGVDDPALWFKAQSSMRYVHHLWYGAQGQWTLQQTQRALHQWLITTAH